MTAETSTGFYLHNCVQTRTNVRQPRTGIVPLLIYILLFCVTGALPPYLHELFEKSSTKNFCLPPAISNERVRRTNDLRESEAIEIHLTNYANCFGTFSESTRLSLPARNSPDRQKHRPRQPVPVLADRSGKPLRCVLL